MSLLGMLGIILISVAAVCGTISYDYKKLLSGYKRMAPIISTLGLFAAFWSFSAGIIPFVRSESVAALFYGTQVIGINLFLLGEAYLVCRMEDINTKTIRIIEKVVFVFGVIDVIIFGFGDFYEFVVDDAGYMKYYVNMGWQVYYHIFHIFFAAATYLFIYIKWRRNLVLKRQQQMMRRILFANIWIIVMTLPNIYMAINHIGFVSTSSIGAVIAFFIIAQSSLEYNSAFINLDNLSDKIFNLSNAGIIIFNTKGELTDINQYAQKLLGVKPSEYLLGRDIFRISEADVKIIFSGKLTKESFRWVAIRTKILCSVTPTIVYDEHEEPFCIICSIFDLTEEERMHNEIIAATKAKSSFLANMSHEIRTPINAVLGMNEMILRETSDPAIREYANDIDSAGKSLLSIINDILDFSKIEMGKMDIIPGEYSLAGAIRNPVEMVKLRAAEKSLVLNVNADEDLPSKLYGDEMRIRQIMTNILNNAVKYTKAGSVSVHISCETVDKDNIVLVYSVKDTGIGIREENIPMLFNSSFTRLDEKKNRNIEGTGLGLSITNQLVTLMGGTIEVQSVYGEGSTFTVHIPQKVVDHSPMGKINKAEAERKPETRQVFVAQGKKVLVVDDVPANLKVFKFLLKKSGINIDAANSGFEAIDKAKANKYDLIFMDHMMPEMDGIEATAKIRELDGNENKDVPVIMLTANAIHGAKEEYLASGFAGYLSKPINPDELDEILREYLS